MLLDWIAKYKRPQEMRKINNIVLHCTATGQDAKISDIQKYWREKLGWSQPGYHYIIEANGKITQLLSIDKVSNGVAGHNSDSIHISYIGGINANGQAQDNRTVAQQISQLKLLVMLAKKFPNAEIKGHRDFAGVKKECPSFDVKNWLKTI